jgi:hypothetical protein
MVQFTLNVQYALNYNQISKAAYFFLGKIRDEEHLLLLNNGDQFRTFWIKFLRHQIQYLF